MLDLEKKIRKLVNYPRTLTKRFRTRRTARHEVESTEVLEFRTTQRRRTTRKKDLARVTGERQPQWISEQKLRQYITPEEFSLMVGGGDTPDKTP